jgi:hypothetical protein
MERQVTSIDKFDLTPEVIKLMKLASRPGPSAQEDGVIISKELSQHVTRIYGRPEMHVLMDLVWHSVGSLQVRRRARYPRLARGAGGRRHPAGQVRDGAQS